MRLSVPGDRIFVILEPLVKEVRGVIMPDNHHERSRIGVVQLVGPEVTGYAPGDKVLLSTYAGVRIHLPGKEIDGQEIDEDCFRIIRAEECLCTLLD